MFAFVPGGAHPLHALVSLPSRDDDLVEPHRLPKVMGPTVKRWWPSPKPEGGVVAVVAWSWVTTCMADRCWSLVMRSSRARRKSRC